MILKVGSAVVFCADGVGGAVKDSEWVVLVLVAFFEDDTVKRADVDKKVGVGVAEGEKNGMTMAGFETGSPDA